MEHNHAQEQQEFPPVSSEFFMSSLLDDLPDTRHNQLLEMLHVPLLHGGVKEVFLLPSFATHSEASFALACILLAITACILELLRLAVWLLERHYLSEGSSGDTNSCRCKQCAFPVLSLGNERKNYNTIHDVQHLDSPSDTSKTSDSKVPSRLQRWTTFVGVGVLQLLTYLGSTMLMLIAMTMNIYLIVSLAVGAALGRLINMGMKQRIQGGRK